MIEVPDEARRRLTLRFGSEVGAWLDGVPALVEALVRRWDLRLDGTVLYGNSALVLPADRGVLKVHPEPAIGADEASALDHWGSAQRGPASHVVGLLEYDDGALLLDRVRPGTELPAATEAIDPAVLPALAQLWTTTGVPPGLGPLTDRMTFGLGLVRRRADDERVRPFLTSEALDRGAAEASVLAAQPGHHGLVHGDLHSRNLLLGPAGAVVVDPRPCVGDRTVDLVDLVLAEPTHLEATITALARELDGLDTGLLHAWCRALAPANAVAALRADPVSEQAAAIVALAVGT